MRNHIILAIGAIQAGVGAFIAVRLVAGAGAPITSSRLLDIAFGAFFLIRGVMNVRTARRAMHDTRASSAGTPPPPPPPLP